MACSKCNNSIDKVGQYDEEFIKSISLSNVTSNKELKDLLSKLETANYVITNFYQMLYNDYIMSINSESSVATSANIETIKRYRTLAAKIQKSYNYVKYIFNFDNPFKSTKR